VRRAFEREGSIGLEEAGVYDWVEDAFCDRLVSVEDDGVDRM